MNQNPKILIVEDEILIADYLVEVLEQEGFSTIRTANDVAAAVAQMNSFVPDILLMDININGKNSGIDLVRSKNHEAAVIFITGQSDLGLMGQAFATNPEAYLTKPIKKNDLVAAIRLLIHKQQQRYITFKDGYQTVRLHVEDILFIKSDNNYIDIQLVDKKYTIRQSLEGFLKEAHSDVLVRIHRSYVVNKDKISAKKSTTVVVGYFEIPFSRNLDLML